MGLKMNWRDFLNGAAQVGAGALQGQIQGQQDREQRDLAHFNQASDLLKTRMQFEDQEDERRQRFLGSVKDLASQTSDPHDKATLFQIIIDENEAAMGRRPTTAFDQLMQKVPAHLRGYFPDVAAPAGPAPGAPRDIAHFPNLQLQLQQHQSLPSPDAPAASTPPVMQRVAGAPVITAENPWTRQAVNPRSRSMTTGADAPGVLLHRQYPMAPKPGVPSWHPPMQPGVTRVPGPHDIIAARTQAQTQASQAQADQLHQQRLLDTADQGAADAAKADAEAVVTVRGKKVHVAEIDAKTVRAEQEQFNKALFQLDTAKMTPAIRENLARLMTMMPVGPIRTKEQYESFLRARQFFEFYIRPGSSIKVAEAEAKIPVLKERAKAIPKELARKERDTNSQIQHRGNQDREAHARTGIMSTNVGSQVHHRGVQDTQGQERLNQGNRRLNQGDRRLDQGDRSLNIKEGAQKGKLTPQMKAEWAAGQKNFDRVVKDAQAFVDKNLHGRWDRVKANGTDNRSRDAVRRAQIVDEAFGRLRQVRDRIEGSTGQVMPMPTWHNPIQGASAPTHAEPVPPGALKIVRKALKTPGQFEALYNAAKNNPALQEALMRAKRQAQDEDRRKIGGR